MKAYEVREPGARLPPVFKENSILPQPFYDADFGNLPVQECRYCHGQEYKERIDYQHGPHDKSVSEKPDSAGNSPHHYHGKQTAKDNRCDNRSHSIIKAFKREHTL